MDGKVRVDGGEREDPGYSTGVIYTGHTGVKTRNVFENVLGLVKELVRRTGDLILKEVLSLP